MRVKQTGKYYSPIWGPWKSFCNPRFVEHCYRWPYDRFCIESLVIVHRIIAATFLTHFFHSETWATEYVLAIVLVLVSFSKLYVLFLHLYIIWILPFLHWNLWYIFTFLLHSCLLSCPKCMISPHIRSSNLPHFQYYGMWHMGIFSCIQDTISCHSHNQLQQLCHCAFICVPVQLR